MRRTGLPILLSAGMLWSCAAPDGVVDGPDAARDRACDAAQYRTMIGQPIDAVDTAALPGPVRVYPAGTAITGDHRPERMNIVVGADGRVVRVGCG